MSRYPHAQPKQVEDVVEGDSFFSSVDMKNERSSLPSGTLALSVNKRLRKRSADTRNGIWPPVFANILDLEMIRGWGVYSNPNGEEVLLVAGQHFVYVMRDGTYPTTLDVDSAMDASVEFVQAHDKVFIFQGTVKKQLVWDGIDGDGFVAITKKTPGDTSTKLIPPAVTAEPIADRLIIIQDDSNVLITDIGDYTSYDHILSVFYVGHAADRIVRVFGYAKGIAIIFTTHGINLLLNFTGDPSLAQVELMNSQLGLAGRNAVTMLGGDVLFLSKPGGIYRVAQAFENRLQTIPLPISDPIQPLIDRINWNAATGAVAESIGEYVYFAIPIDGSEFNNALIVFNGATNIIEGYDTFPEPLQIDDLKVTLYQGTKRMFILDKNAARIYVTDEGKSDFVYDPDTEETTEHQIADKIETRGYVGAVAEPITRRSYPSSRSDFKGVMIGVTTWAPSIIVTELTETANDERPLNVNPIVKSRTEYDTFGRKDWNSTNVNDDWDTMGRQDYSVIADNQGFDLGSGIDTDRKQTHTLRFSTKARGRYVSYRIENNQGQADVTGVIMESSGTQREARRAG